MKKFIAEQDLTAEHRYVPEVVTPTRTGGFDDKIAVIGTGPAGLSCAFYLAEKGYKPVITGGFDDKIAVIGTGPAGLSCAFYLAEKGYKPVIFEKNARPGGMLTYGIPSYKLEKDVSIPSRSCPTP